MPLLSLGASVVVFYPKLSNQAITSIKAAQHINIVQRDYECLTTMHSDRRGTIRHGSFHSEARWRLRMKLAYLQLIHPLASPL